MGNLQGGDKSKQKEGKASKSGGLLTKTKKSPVKDLFKHQVSGGGGGSAGGKKTLTPAHTKPPEDPVSVTGGGGNDRGTSCGLIVTDSWRRVGALQQQQQSEQSVPEKTTEAVSPETSSSDSVFTDPLVSAEPPEDDVTLTMETTSDEESTPLAVKRRLDSLDEEAERESPSRTKSLDKLEAKTFTVVRHRKVELAPSKLSEQCLISAGNSTQPFHTVLEAIRT